MNILEELRQQGKFFEFFHVSWSLVEFRADESILRAYGLSSQDARAKPLLDLSFSRKIDVFKSMKVLSTDDYGIISEFRRERNNLFHKGGLYLSNITNEEKEKVMAVGAKAVQVMERLSFSLGEKQNGRYLYPIE